MDFRPCPNCSRADAWDVRRGAWGRAVELVLPFRRYTCGACGRRTWSWAEPPFTLPRTALWAAAAVALGWQMGRPSPPGRNPSEVPAAADIEPAPPAVEDRAASATTELAVLVPLWIQAWSSGAADEYLSFYSPDVAADARRGPAPVADDLQVDLSDFAVEIEGADRATVRFRQSVQAGGTVETTRWQVDLTRRRGAWKIARERQAPTAPRSE